MKSMLTGIAALTITFVQGTTVIHETFDDLDAERFLTEIPNQYTQVRDGVLWTRGDTGTPYPPMVFMPIRGNDLTISFRFRQLGDGEWLWFFVDGDDGFGGSDHMLRVKLLRDAIRLQVDSHTLDADHPGLDKLRGRRKDPVSGAYRINEFLPVEKLDLSDNDWHEVKIVFHDSSVAISLEESKWSTTLDRPAFTGAKEKVIWMQKGGEQGIEIDDIRVEPTDTSE